MSIMKLSAVLSLIFAYKLLMELVFLFLDNVLIKQNQNLFSIIYLGYEIMQAGNIASSRLKLPNVIRYCERQLIETTFRSISDHMKFRIAMRFNMKNLLLHVLKKSPLEFLKYHLLDHDYTNMSSEMLKTCTKCLFDSI